VFEINACLSLTIVMYRSSPFCLSVCQN